MEASVRVVNGSCSGGFAYRTDALVLDNSHHFPDWRNYLYASRAKDTVFYYHRLDCPADMLTTNLVPYVLLVNFAVDTSLDSKMVLVVVVVVEEK